MPGIPRSLFSVVAAGQSADNATCHCQEFQIIVHFIAAQKLGLTLLDVAAKYGLGSHISPQYFICQLARGMWK